jgi:predicted dehydrogenase
MGDLGMHALHLPLRLGWKPERVYAQLQKGPPERPDGKGGSATCDTWDNALVHGSIPSTDGPVPIRFEMKRLAPGATNTWFFEALGTEGGARFSTADPKAVHLFSRGKEQTWSRLETGHEMGFKTVTGGIFEAGFPDIFLQMWAAYLAEREGVLGDRFGCATVEEAVASHEVFDAALCSQITQTVQEVGGR